MANGGGQTQSNASAESWLMQVKRTFQPDQRMWQLSKNVCIYRVPKLLMISKREAYVPLVVSLGPYHHKMNPTLSTMDQHKVEAVHRMLARLNIDVTIVIAEIQKLDSKIRECYEEAIEFDEETLAWMLTMDGCFVLEFFRSWIVPGDCFSLVFQDNDHTNVVYWDILSDIMKLENQIPLFILITLLRLEFGRNEHAVKRLSDLVESSILFQGYPLSSYLLDDGVNSNLQEHIQKDPCHLLDLYRMVIKHMLTHSTPESAIAVERDGRGGAHNISSDHKRSRWPINVRRTGWMQRLSCMDILPRAMPTLSRDDSRFTPSAELLQKAGIEFKPGQIRFEKRRFGSNKFCLPQINVDDITETYLRNLMAYEECQRCSSSPEETIVSHYVILLDDLIDSKRDVSVLRKSQVILGRFGSDENVAGMFNKLTDGIAYAQNKQIEVVMREAREHYNSQWKVWMSQFKEEHFSKPWYILSLVAAILILGMTAVQTVCSVKK